MDAVSQLFKYAIFKNKAIAPDASQLETAQDSGVATGVATEAAPTEERSGAPEIGADRVAPPPNQSGRQPLSPTIAPPRNQGGGQPMSPPGNLPPVMQDGSAPPPLTEGEEPPPHPVDGTPLANVWIYGGEAYDLTELIMKHPGVSSLLDAARIGILRRSLIFFIAILSASKRCSRNTL
jgi:hypothetical protein